MAQIIGLSPNNLISPIDFIPGVGPALKIAKGVRFLNRARKTRKGKGAINYINAFGDDLMGLGNVASGYVLARATTVPLVPHVYRHRKFVMAYGGGTAIDKTNWWLDYLDFSV
jgi:hypothetical protein